MISAKRLAWRNRVFSFLCAGSYLGCVHMFTDDTDLRANINYGVVITLGYGHLIGAAFFSRQRLAEKLRSATRNLAAHMGTIGRHYNRSTTSSQHIVGFTGFVVLLSLLFISYLALLKQIPEAWLLMLAISIWHSIENDHNLEETYRAQHKLPKVTHATHEHLLDIGASSCVMAWGLTLIEPDWASASLTLRVLGLACGAGLNIGERRTHIQKWSGVLLIGAASVPPDWVLPEVPIRFSDLFTASILYHLASWGVLSIEKVCRSDTSTSTKRDMLFVHMLPLLILSSTYVWPLAWGSALRADFLAPTSYLFWSATHVIQTAWLRGRRPDL